MPTLAAALDFAKLEARNLRAHQLGAPPSSPVSGQLYYNNADNTLYWWDGTAWISGRGGTIPDASTTVKGIIQLAGDLAGTAASPQIATGVLTSAEVNPTYVDGSFAIPSMRTLGTGSSAGNKAMAGNTDLSIIANNNATSAAVPLNNKQIVGLGQPTSDNDAATKVYVDSVAQGLDSKLSVRVATVTVPNMNGPETVDGVTVQINDRVLVKDHTLPRLNGIYIVNSGAWTRAPDGDTWNEYVSAYVWVEQGTTNADTGWVCTVDSGGTLGTTSITWTQFSGAAQIVAGGGLTKSGNQLDVGAGPGITINADTIQVANDGITNAMLADNAVNLGITSNDYTGVLPVLYGGTGQASAPLARNSLVAAGYYSSATHGAGTTITITQNTHVCRATRGLMVQVQDEATGNVELADVSVAANGDVTVTFGVAVAANSKRVTIIG